MGFEKQSYTGCLRDAHPRSAMTFHLNQRALKDTPQMSVGSRIMMVSCCLSSSVVVGWFAIMLFLRLWRHAPSHAAFGYEYLVAAIPFSLGVFTLPLVVLFSNHYLYRFSNRWGKGAFIAITSGVTVLMYFLFLLLGGILSLWLKIQA